MDTPSAGIRDAESGLYSRAYFDETIGRELERCRRHGFSLSVVSVVLDLDGVEALAGRDVAREILIAAGRALSAATRETDLVFRWEADELLVLLFDADAHACRTKTGQLNALFEEWREGGGPVPQPVRIGIGSATADEEIVFAAVLQAARAASRGPVLAANA